jgi:sec-independent protein translocase protein TatB
MFDIGFWEIAVIAVVALLVVGPKELPTLLRTMGAMVKKMRRFIREAKADLDKEINKVDELKRLMDKETEIAELHKDIERDVDKPTIPVNPSSVDKKEMTAGQQTTEPQKSVDGQSPEDSAQPPYGTTK